MTLISKFAITLSLVSFFSGNLVFSDDGYRSKVGFDLKGFKPNLQNGIGWLGGFRWARYYGTSQVSMGLAAYFGSATGRPITDERLYYGGLTLGLDGRLSRSFIYELGSLFGYGEGVYRNLGVEEKSYWVVEPSLALGVALGGGWRLSFSGSYVHMTNAKMLSGPTFGFRIQYRSQSTVKDVND